MTHPLANPFVITAIGAMLFFIVTVMFVSLHDLTQDK